MKRREGTFIEGSSEENFKRRNASNTSLAGE
jgi:hypothetical protein